MYQRIRAFLKLRYIGKMTVPGYSGDLRMWDVISPVLPEYKGMGKPTFTLAGLKERNLL